MVGNPWAEFAEDVADVADVAALAIVRSALPQCLEHRLECFHLAQQYPLVRNPAEAQRLIKAWRINYNESRPHMALGNKTAE
jgi:transposase InsO family protein